MSVAMLYYVSDYKNTLYMYTYNYVYTAGLYVPVECMNKGVLLCHLYARVIDLIFQTLTHALTLTYLAEVRHT